MAIREWLVQSSYDQLVVVAARLGRHQQKGEKQNFSSELWSLGMPVGEIEDYWNAVDSTFGSQIFSGDRRLAAECGILLSEKVFPRNYLLYRLAQLLNPQTLSVFIEVIDHKYEVASDRWEYAGEGQKRIMTVRLKRTAPPIPKKPKQKRRRRTSDYELERLC